MGNREDLLAGARRCLAEKGYARTTVRDIAAAAGVSMAAIGYHFGSREGLLNAALFESIDALGAETGRALSRGVSAETYEQSWQALLDSLRTNREVWMASIEAYVQAQHSAELRAQLAEGMEEGRSGVTAHLLQRDESTLEPDAIRTLGSIAMALMSGLSLQHLVDPDRAPTPAQIVEGIRLLASVIAPADAAPDGPA